MSVHGHSDWFLPSKGELNVVYDARNSGDLARTFNMIDGFPLSYYWTSSEAKNTLVWYQNFATGTQDDFRYKHNLKSPVRCVRTDGSVGNVAGEQGLAQVLSVDNDANGIRIIGLPFPSDGFEAANKAYVDLMIEALRAELTGND